MELTNATNGAKKEIIIAPIAAVIIVETDDEIGQLCRDFEDHH